MSKRNVLAKFYEKFEHVVFIDIGLVCQDRKGKNVTIIMLQNTAIDVLTQSTAIVSTYHTMAVL